MYFAVIYAFFSVNFILQKFCLCKKNDKYEVWFRIKHVFGLPPCELVGDQWWWSLITDGDHWSCSTSMLLLLLLMVRFIFCLPDCRKLSETTWSLARARLVLLATQQEEWLATHWWPTRPACHAALLRGNWPFVISVVVLFGKVKIPSEMEGAPVHELLTLFHHLLCLHCSYRLHIVAKGVKISTDQFSPPKN